MPDIVLPTAHAAQERVLRERKRYNVVACGRRWGKTKMGGSLALQAALNGLPVGWFAPSYKTLQDALDEILGRVKPAGSWAHYDSQNKKLNLGSGGSIEFWTTNPDKAGDKESDVARGRKYKRLVYDEPAHARRFKADWTKALRPTLVDYRGDAWFFSTPRGQNYFYELFRRGQDGTKDWQSWSMPTSENPHVAPEEIAAAKEDLPADAFQQEFLAEFLADAANPFGINAIRACIGDLAQGPVQWWGVDLAKSQDHTVAIGLNAKGEVCVFQRWQKSWRETTPILCAMLDDAPSLVDSTGVGNPIVEQLQAKCGGMVEGYIFTSQSKQQLMEGLAWAIQNKALTYPAGEIVNELETFQYEYKPSGVRYTAPEGLHDDCVCALALAQMCRLRRKPAALHVMGVGARGVDVFAAGYEREDDDRIWS